MENARMMTLANPPAVETRAAMYVRMSTDGQNYSLEHQRAAIYGYATKFRFEIVREYSDEGKSGLDIKHRAGLRTLMSDVLSGATDFAVIVVYDVSRWGRFQDVDEAAYYEYTCRRAGIQVCYCAEQFQNDGSPLSSLLKSIKRTMAAEYSRELSAKVFNAQCRFVALGYKQGGSAGYGLRRLALTDEGLPRGTLAYKERKTALTDRVVLVLGPAFEVSVVKRIYSLYLDDGMGDAAIARLLNAERIESEFGRPWTCWLVATILTNMKYAGCLVFNKRSCKLQSAQGANAAAAWVVNDGAIEQLLPPERFKMAQIERIRRSRSLAPEELLASIQTCYRKHGRVSSRILAGDPSMPDPETFSRCFGSLVAAYDLAGIPRERTFRFIETKKLLLAIQEEIKATVCALIPMAGGTVRSDPAADMLLINGCVRVRVDTTTSRCLQGETIYWKVIPRPGSDFILSARLDADNRKVLDYFLIPANEISDRPIYLRPSKPERFDRLRYPSIEAIFGLKGS